MKLCGLFRNYYIHISGSELYITKVGLIDDVIATSNSHSQLIGGYSTVQYKSGPGGGPPM
jgi:hypothetical protein